MKYVNMEGIMTPYIVKNNKNKFIIGIIAFVVCVLIAGLVILSKLLAVPEKIEGNVIKLDIPLYISLCDEKSKDFAQINWKEVVSILGAKHDGKFQEIKDSEIEELAQKFVEEKPDKKFRVKAFEIVLNEIGLSDEEKEKSRKYLNDIKFFAISKSIGEDSNNLKFIEEIKVQAKDTYKKYGVLPSITIAQAILETGWGSSQLNKEANNYFGIKADKAWKGPKINMKTKEYSDKVITDAFRVYNNKNDSFKDHGEFLKNNERYAKAGLFKAGHYTEQANALQKAGYSTVQDKSGTPIYGKMLVDIIKDNNLMLIDNEVQKEQ